jgi:hypothetical protein
MEDVHGGSDIYKISTKMVSFGSRQLEDSYEKFETFFKLEKFRQWSAARSFTGRVIFDTSLNAYEKGYELGSLKVDKWEQSIKTPPWWLKSVKKYSQDKSNATVSKLMQLMNN